MCGIDNGQWLVYIVMPLITCSLLQYSWTHSPLGHATVISNYRKIPNIRLTKSQNLNVSRIVLQLSLRNLLKQGVKSRMMM